jgi:hypothetical protein
MNRSDRDISRLISDYPVLHHWKNHPDIRKPAKQVNSKRLLVPSFDISPLTDLLQHIKKCKSLIGSERYNTLNSCD